MSTIMSKVEAVEKLRFEPFPSGRVLKDLRIYQTERQIVAIDDKTGTIYSTQVSARVAYSIGCDLEETLKACVKLGALTRQAVVAHQKHVALVNIIKHRARAAENLQRAARDLGVKLTSAQTGAIERAKKERAA